MRTWLKDVRKARNLTQAQVAELSRIARPYYTRIENGEYDIPVPTAKKIASALNFDWNIFYDDSMASCEETKLQ